MLKDLQIIAQTETDTTILDNIQSEKIINALYDKFADFEGVQALL